MFKSNPIIKHLWICPADVIHPGKDKLQKEKENKGLFGMFRKGSKKKPDQVSADLNQFQIGRW